MFHERLLQGMKPVGSSNAFDGCDNGAVAAYGEYQATVDPITVNEHGTCTTLAMIAPLLGARKIKLLSQQIKQRHPRLDSSYPYDAVDGVDHAVCCVWCRIHDVTEAPSPWCSSALLLQTLGAD